MDPASALKLAAPELLRKVVLSPFWITIQNPKIALRDVHLDVVGVKLLLHSVETQMGNVSKPQFEVLRW